MEHHNVCVFDVEFNCCNVLDAEQVFGGLELNDALVLEIFVFLPGPLHLTFPPLNYAALSVFKSQHLYQFVYLINFIPGKFFERLLLDKDVDDIFSRLKSWSLDITHYILLVFGCTILLIIFFKGSLGKNYLIGE